MRPASLLLLVAAVAALSCSDALLQPPEVVVEPVTGELTVDGEFCTDSPEDVVFPVKVLFLVGTSGSNQFTDPNQQRAIAVEQVIDRHIGNPGVQFAVIRFDGRIRNLTGGFTNDRGVLQEAVELLREADSVTDYQGALGTAFTTLLTDMQRSEPAELVRTKYVTVFFSDGTPQPMCSRDGDEGDKFLICELHRDRLRGIPNDVFIELEAGADYNQPYQIFDKIEAIMALKEEFRVGDLRFHTGFLYDEDEAAVAEAAFALDPDAGRELMEEMARLGNGQFMAFSDGDEINFLTIDFNSIKRPFTVKSFIVSNEATAPTETVPAVDSDRDGMSDDEEFALRDKPGLDAGDQAAGTPRAGRTDPPDPDTAGDGFSDLFEARLLVQGFHPTDPDRPSIGCAQIVERGTLDPDRDGLLSCEEKILGSQPDTYDSDADGLPDRIEFIYGLDPADPRDAKLDLDLDGLRNFDEVRSHTAPGAKPIHVPGGLDRYRYRMDALPDTLDGRKCFHFETRHVGLVTPDKEGGERYGLNEIKVYLGQVPEDQPADFGLFKVACFQARFDAPDFLQPESGRVTLTDADFFKSGEFDPTLHCRRPDGEYPDPLAP